MDLNKVFGKVLNTGPIKNLLREGEANVDRICIPLDKKYDGVDISNFVFEIRAESEKDTLVTQVLKKSFEQDEIRLTWTVTSSFTAVSGWLDLVIVGLNSDGTEVIMITGEKISVKKSNGNRYAPTPNAIADALNRITLLTNRAIVAADSAEASAGRAQSAATSAASASATATQKATAAASASATATQKAATATTQADRAKAEADRATEIAGFDVTEYYKKSAVDAAMSTKANKDEVSTQLGDKVNNLTSKTSGSVKDLINQPSGTYAISPSVSDMPSVGYPWIVQSSGDGFSVALTTWGFITKETGYEVITYERFGSLSNWTAWTKKALSQPPVEMNLPVASGFVASGASFSKDQFKRVYIGGQIQKTNGNIQSDTEVIMTLPTDCLPKKPTTRAITIFGGGGAIVIDLTNGNVIPYFVPKENVNLINLDISYIAK